MSPNVLPASRRPSGKSETEKIAGETPAARWVASPHFCNVKQPLSKNVSFVNLITAAGSIGCLLTVTAFLSGVNWAFDLTCHFRLQYTIVLILLTGLLIPFRRFRTAIIFAVFGLINLSVLLPFWTTPREHVTPSAKSLKLLLMNVKTENFRFDLVKAHIRAESPDIILLEETDARWLTELRDLTNDYLYSVTAPREDNFGIALFSRLPLQREEIIYLGDEGVPSVKAEIDLGTTNILFVGTHPVPPVRKIGQWYRNEQLRAIAEYLAKSPRPVILLGDLNVTPWSTHFKTLIRDAKVKNTAEGFGIQSSWPSHLFPLRIPIDHCLISASLKTVQRRIGPNVGSDHFPVFVEIALD